MECDADRNISDSNVNSDANKSAVSEVIHEQDVVHEVLDGVEASGDSTISCANETSKPNDVKRGKLGMVYHAFVPPPAYEVSYIALYLLTTVITPFTMYLSMETNK